VQDTLLRAWKNLAQLQEAKAAKAWLLTILRHENAAALNGASSTIVTSNRTVSKIPVNRRNIGSPPIACIV
jgi:DNA-directed RNA polymerase specialized sigma24 family protein